MLKTFDLMQLSELGSNLIIDASLVQPFDLKRIAENIKSKGSHLTLKNISKVLMFDLKQIVESCEGHVTLDFS